MVKLAVKVRKCCLSERVHRGHLCREVIKSRFHAIACVTVVSLPDNSSKMTKKAQGKTGKDQYHHKEYSGH